MRDIELKWVLMLVYTKKDELEKRQQEVCVIPAHLKFPRPEIKLDSTAKDWEEFTVTWTQYKQEYNLAGAGLIRQLIACCSEEMRQKLSRLTGGKQFDLSEIQLLSHMKNSPRKASRTFPGGTCPCHPCISHPSTCPHSTSLRAVFSSVATFSVLLHVLL